MPGVPEAGRCSDCGTGLVAEPGIGGLCPQCLLSLALRQSPQADPDHGSPAPGEALTLDRPRPGRILGERYQIRELLGRGGMGEVFRAFDLKLRVGVALKAVRAEKVGSERADEQLRQEVRSTGVRSVVWRRQARRKRSFTIKHRTRRTRRAVICVPAQGTKPRTERPADS